MCLYMLLCVCVFVQQRCQHHARFAVSAVIQSLEPSPKDSIRTVHRIRRVSAGCKGCVLPDTSK